MWIHQLVYQMCVQYVFQAFRRISEFAPHNRPALNMEISLTQTINYLNSIAGPPFVVKAWSQTRRR